MILCHSPDSVSLSAAAVPSPPSAIGILMMSASLKTVANPVSMAPHTSLAVRLSLNESGAITIFTVLFLKLFYDRV